MRRRASGTPVYLNTEKLLNNRDEDKDMSYNDEHYGSSKIAYDGELIDLQDGQIRYKRDEARQRYYEWAEDRVDDEQLTWDEVENALTAVQR